MLRGLYLLWKDHGYGVWRLVCYNSMIGHNRLSLVFPEMDGFLLEENHMKKLYPNHDLLSGLLPGERMLSDISVEKECPKKDQNKTA